MALPTGTITMSQVNDELCYSSTRTITLNDTKVRQLAEVPSGTISMDDLRGKSGFTMTGGTTFTPGDGYKYHFFTSSSTAPYSGAGCKGIQVFVVAGGGGCFGGALSGGGGGGGCRLVYVNLPAPSASAPTTVTIGGGGSISRAFGVQCAQGGESAQNANGEDGGSGAGGSYPGGSGGLGNSPATSPPQGNPGGDSLSSPTVFRGSGGGGGGSTSGEEPSPNLPARGGSGGAGYYLPPGWSIPPTYGTPKPSGASPGLPFFLSGRFFAGGGGGAGYQTNGGQGGTGGGGPGGAYNYPGAPVADNGDANTGGGGGGSGSPPGAATNGGSGIVIIRYPV